MGAREAAIGSALFFLLAPGTIAGLMPWLITRWRIEPDASSALTLAGAVLVIPCGVMLIECFARFVRHGGTPAPIMPTEHLVVTGLYRRVRNPMYVAVTGLDFRPGALVRQCSFTRLWHRHLAWVSSLRARLRRTDAETQLRGRIPRLLPRRAAMAATLQTLDAAGVVKTARFCLRARPRSLGWLRVDLWVALWSLSGLPARAGTN